MEGSRIRSIFVGIIIGAILGGFFYQIIGWFLVSGSFTTNNFFLPIETSNYMFSMVLSYGIIPGSIVGFLVGIVLPLLSPPGHFSASIGSSLWIICTPLAWLTYWDFVARASIGRICLTGLITLLSFIFIIPISKSLGFYLERFRYKGGIS